LPTWMQNQEQVRRETLGYCLRKYPNDVGLAHWFATKQWLSFYGEHPRIPWRQVDPLPPSFDLVQRVRYNMIRYVNAKKKGDFKGKQRATG
jgi:hypothetical protein